MPDRDELIAIGRIAKVRGVRGELIVALLTDFPERFYAMEKLLLEDPASGTIEERELASVRDHKSQIAIMLKGIETRNAAESLVGAFLYIGKEELVELPEGSYFQFEIVGMKVLTEEGKLLGEVAEVLQFPANDVWRIEGDQEILVPAIKDVVRQVDRRKREITIHLLDGLIRSEANEPEESS